MAASLEIIGSGLSKVRASSLSYITLASKISQSGFHTSTCVQVNHRKERAIMQHLHYRDHEKSLTHRNSPLVALPDYSYTDGRPTEISVCQKARQEKNYNLAKTVVQLLGEMKFAQEHNLALEKEKSEKIQARLDSRLKPKVED